MAEAPTTKIEELKQATSEKQPQIQSNAEEGEITKSKSLDIDDKKAPSLEKKPSVKEVAIKTLKKTFIKSLINKKKNF